MGIKKSNLLFYRLLATILGAFIALSFLFWNFQGTVTNFEDASTFGAETTSIFSMVDGIQIHCSDSRDIVNCIHGARVRHALNSVLWLGNSQLHAINQWHKGEKNAPPILFDHLKLAGFDLIVLSEPNANLQEHWILFEYMLKKIPLKTLILPVVFDDAREGGLRKEVAQLLDDQDTRARISQRSIGQKLINTKDSNFNVADGNEDTAGIAHTLQERFEHFLNNALESCCELWRSRPEARGQLMNSLYVWRNFLFGINPSTKRKIIRGRYQDNISALAAILEDASQYGISVFIYIPPIRNDVQIPYDESEYRSFKVEVKLLADRYGARFENLEDLVPAKYWGRKDSTSISGDAELDFMHFQAGGHKLLADELARYVLGERSSKGVHR